MINNNYYSHKWETKRYTSPDGDDIACYCVDCGIENLGDPNEFPDLIYPPCDEETEWMS